MRVTNDAIDGVAGQAIRRGIDPRWKAFSLSHRYDKPPCAKAEPFEEFPPGLASHHGCYLDRGEVPVPASNIIMQLANSDATAVITTVVRGKVSTSSNEMSMPPL
jgi:hypothetical protein